MQNITHCVDFCKQLPIKSQEGYIFAPEGVLHLRIFSSTIFNPARGGQGFNPPAGRAGSPPLGAFNVFDTLLLAAG